MVGKIAIAVLLLGGLVAGALIGGVVSGTEPALLGWLFGAGSGADGRGLHRRPRHERGPRRPRQ